MKIISWNCQGAFRTKASNIAAYKPDIAIIQECEHEDKLYNEANFPRPQWSGDLSFWQRRGCSGFCKLQKST